MAKKRRKRSGGFRLPGGVGPKAVLFGALGLTLAPRILPVQSPGAIKLGTGLALRALKIGGGGPLAAVGMMELAAQFLSGAAGGALPFLGGGGGVVNGGFDY